MAQRLPNDEGASVTESSHRYNLQKCEIIGVNSEEILMKYASADQIKKELREAKVTAYGLLKQESRFLHKTIQEDEHIKAAIYGLYGDSKGVESSSGMLVATDRRMIFMDKKPLITDIDEFGYESVIGINVNNAMLFSAVDLHTRNKEYKFRNVNKRCARHMKSFIESYVLENPNIRRNDLASAWISKIRQPAPVKLSDKAIDFIRAHDTAVLSTINKEQEIDAATIHYIVDKDNRIYFMTKSSTAKAHNILRHCNVALTIYDKEKVSTAQIKGISDLIEEPELKNYVYNEITRPRSHKGAIVSAPLTKIKEGSFEVFCITMTECKYSDYRDRK